MPPIILIVLGHWHTTFHAQPLLRTLNARGYEAKAIQQTSVGLKTPRPSFASDVDLITTSILTELETGKDVVLVLHSVAGICGAEALNRVLSVSSSQGDQQGKVVRVLLIAAYVFAAGVVMDAQLFVNDENPGFSISEPDLLLHMSSPAHRFFNDLSPADAQPFVDTLEPTYYLYQGPVVSSENWRSLPVTYLLCEKDNAVPVDRQEAVSQGLEVVRVDLGHSPFVGHAGVVADIIEKLLA